MRRRRRWFVIARFLLAPLFAGAPLALTSCAMLSGETKVTNPATGPGTDYPCGYRGMLCSDTSPPTCCILGVCANDGEPYCDQRPQDPMDPDNFGLRRAPREPGKWVARASAPAS